MTCRKVRRLLSVRREWTRGEQALVEAHLAECLACQAIAGAYERMDRCLQLLPAPGQVVASPATVRLQMMREQDAKASARSRQRRAVQGLVLLAVVALIVAGGVMLGTRRVTPGTEPGIGQPDSRERAVQLEHVPSPTPTSQDGRINVLLLGIDRRGGTSWGYRTDAILVITVDPAHKTAGMLSVPRDLQVEIPGVGEDRINTANGYGYVQNYPGGGPALLEKTIEASFGILIDYFVMIDYEGFAEVVDTLGGIDVDVPRTLHDTGYPDPKPGDPHAYRTVHFDAGRQHMDGEQALIYARSRMSTSDLDRVKRQQLLLLAIREKALTLNLIPRLPPLLAAMEGKIQTDLTLDKMIQLASLLPAIEPASIKQAVIQDPMVYAYRRPDGAAVLLPRWHLLQPVVEDLFSAGQAAGPSATPARTQAISYTVQVNDTVWSIARRFGLQAETIVWSNPELEQWPDLLVVGQALLIPLVDGVWYTVQPGDTIEGLAEAYQTSVEKIVSFGPNGLEVPYTLTPGKRLMLPDGKKEMRIAPRYPMTGTLTVPEGAPQGSGHFAWPTEGVLTQAYWSGHQAIDIANRAGIPVRAADDGYVLLSGHDAWGYGNQILIDHGNGYRTGYGHLDTLLVRAGDFVRKNQEIGTMGSTGRTTGPALDFRIWEAGEPVDPLPLLP